MLVKSCVDICPSTPQLVCTAARWELSLSIQSAMDSILQYGLQSVNVQASGTPKEIPAEETPIPFHVRIKVSIFV